MIRTLICTAFKSVRIQARPNLPYYLFSTEIEKDNNNTTMKCYKCGQPGHFAKNCQQKQQIVCRYCKKPGHLISACPDKPVSSVKCYNCGQSGHMSRQCPNPKAQNTQRPERKVTCYICQQEGHISRNCPQKSEAGRQDKQGKTQFKKPGRKQDKPTHESEDNIN